MKARRILTMSLLLSGMITTPAFAAVGKLRAEAQRHFDAGLAYADDPSGPKWEEAYKEFQAAYALHPTWELKNNIALCALHLERDGEAIEAYRAYLAPGGEKDLSPKHRQQIERDIAMLSASLVKITLDVHPSEGVLVDERKNSKGELRINRYPFKDGKASIGIHPGSHKLTVEAPGFVSASWSFDAEPGSSHHHEFRLVPEAPPLPDPDQRGSRDRVASRTPLGVYVGLAATGVFAAAATVTGVIALNKDSQYDESSDPAERDRLRESGQTWVLLTNIGAGAAVLSAGVTAFFYFTAPRAVPVVASKSAMKVVPVATPTAAGLAVLGNF